MDGQSQPPKEEHHWSTARYICFEGGEGVGKTTQVALLIDWLRNLGHSVLGTKEPGTALLPVSLRMREIMLSQEFEAQMTDVARELVSQAARSVTLERVVLPALKRQQFVVSDRGLMSGFAYALALGHAEDFLQAMAEKVIPAELRARGTGPKQLNIYSNVVYLRSGVRSGLERAAQAKQEFAAGDVMEAKSVDFHERVRANFDLLAERYSFIVVQVDGKTPEQVRQEIWHQLALEPPPQAAEP